MQRYPDQICLLQIAAERVANVPNYPAEQLAYLPKNLLEKVLWIRAKRGTLDDQTLQYLVDKDTKILDLSECDISDEGLKAVDKCTNLRKIDLNSMQTRTNVTDTGVAALASCSFLNILFLRRCINVSDNSLALLAVKCQNLSEINLCGCTLITDVTLIALGANCPQLTCLNAAHTNVTDLGVHGLVSKVCSQSLKELDLSDCRIGDEGVEAVIMYCPNLRIFIVQGVEISPMARASLDELALANKMKQLSWTIY